MDYVFLATALKSGPHGFTVIAERKLLNYAPDAVPTRQEVYRDFLRGIDAEVIFFYFEPDSVPAGEYFYLLTLRRPSNEDDSLTVLTTQGVVKTHSISQVLMSELELQKGDGWFVEFWHIRPNVT